MWVFIYNFWYYNLRHLWPKKKKKGKSFIWPLKLSVYIQIVYIMVKCWCLYTIFYIIIWGTCIQIVYNMVKCGCLYTIFNIIIWGTCIQIVYMMVKCGCLYTIFNIIIWGTCDPKRKKKENRLFDPWSWVYIYKSFI